MKSKVRVDWYKLLYLVQDQKLINNFWFWYYHHKIKSKNKAAKIVIKKYYSTTPAPRFVLDAFGINETIRIAHVKWCD